MALGGDKGRDMRGPAPSPAPTVPLSPWPPGPELQVSMCRSPFASQGLSWHIRSLGSTVSDEGPLGVYTFL